MLIIFIVLIILILALIAFYFWAGSGTLENDQLSELITFRTEINEPSSKPDEFTVMTYNLGYLSGMSNNRALRPPKSFFDKNLEDFIQILENTQPHFIALQEIDYHSRRSYYTDQLETIARQAGFPFAAKAINWDKRYVPFPYWPPSIQFGPVLSGQAVLSRFPILETGRIVLPKPGNNPFYYNHFYLDRLIQTAKIKAGEQTIVLINIHLEAYHIETRESQAKKVLDIYRSYKKDYPVLLIGDFNSLPPDAVQKNNFSDELETDFSGDETIQLFLKEPGLKAAYLSKNQGFTFPSDRPTRKLDYIFYSHEKIQLIDTYLTPSGSSDHLPLYMRFQLIQH